jgi:hypothetical protein
MLEQGLSIRFEAHGGSMSPTIRDGEIVEVKSVERTMLRKNDIVLAKSEVGFRLHRIVTLDRDRDVFVTRGDCGQENDPPISGSQILGLAWAKEVRIGRSSVRATFKRGRIVRSAARAQYLLMKLLRIASTEKDQRREPKGIAS